MWSAPMSCWWAWLSHVDGATQERRFASSTSLDVGCLYGLWGWLFLVQTIRAHTTVKWRYCSLGEMGFKTYRLSIAWSRIFLGVMRLSQMKLGLPLRDLFKECHKQWHWNPFGDDHTLLINQCTDYRVWDGIKMLGFLVSFAKIFTRFKVVCYTGSLSQWNLIHSLAHLWEQTLFLWRGQKREQVSHQLLTMSWCLCRLWWQLLAHERLTRK